MNKILVLLYMMATLSYNWNVEDVLPQKEGTSDLLKFYSGDTTKTLKHSEDSIIDQVIEVDNKEEKTPQETCEEVVETLAQIEETPQVSNLTQSTRQIDINKPMVALTFDDGPNPINTNKILDTLEKYNVVATFFDLGYLVENNPQVVKREEKLGCEVGNHSYRHVDLNKLNAEQIQQDMEQSEGAFEKALGHKTKLFRPPYGKANNTVKSTITYPLINWNVDTVDWESRDASKIIDKFREIANYDGKIILMHSIYASTAKAVETIVPELLEKGYQLVTVSELANNRGYENLENGRIYYGFAKQ